MQSESPLAASSSEAAPLRALCIARHRFLSEHIARYFAHWGLSTSSAVGLDAAADVAITAQPDVIICDYDLLASIPLAQWEQDGLLSTTPVIAVSLTRKTEELYLLDSNGIAGFLYLPTLDEIPALKIVRAAASRKRYSLAPQSHAPRQVEHS
jgi:DNA-binding NarL/FixJ family response regulator